MRRRNRGKVIRRCPQCGSTRLVFEGGLILGQIYHCLDCDYVGSLVVEEEEPAPSSRASAPPR
jgi:transposase-like protein